MVDLRQLSYDEIDFMSPLHVANLSLQSGISQSQTLYEARRLLKEKVTLERSAAGLCEGLSRNEFIEIIEKHVQRDAERRKALSLHLKEAQNLQSKLHLLSVDDLEDASPETRNAIDELKILPELPDIEFTSSSACPLMIIGESGSGKSCFTNLLLGEDLLPTSIQNNTSSFVRVEYGDTREAEFYNEDGNEMDHITDCPDFVDRIRPLLENKEYRKDRTCGHAVLRCNAPILKGGLQLIDTVGLGEQQFFDDKLLDHLKYARGFIFLCKMTNPLGDDSVDGLFSVVKYLREKLDHSHFGSALFVINMWDEIQADNKEDKPKSNALNFMFNRLKQCWPELEKDGVLPLSTKDAHFMQKRDVMSEEISRVLQAINRLWVHSIHSSTHSLTHRILKYCHNVSPKTSVILIENKPDLVDEQFKCIEESITDLKKKRTNLIKYCSNKITQEKAKVRLLLKEHIKHPATMERIIQSIGRETQPPDMSDLKKIKSYIIRLVSRILRKEFDKWEGTERIFDGIRQTFIDIVLRDFDDFEKINLGLDESLSSLTNPLKLIDESALTLTNSWNVSNVLENFWNLRRETSRQFGLYLKSSCAYIQAHAERLLKGVIDARGKNLPIERYIQHQIDSINALISSITDAIDARVQELEKVRSELRHRAAEREVIMSAYSVIHSRIRHLENKISRFAHLCLEASQNDCTLDEFVASKQENDPEESNGLLVCLTKGCFKIDGLQSLHKRVPASLLEVDISRERNTEFYTRISWYKELQLNPNPRFLKVVAAVKYSCDEELSKLHYVTEPYQIPLATYFSNKRMQLSADGLATDHDFEKHVLVRDVFEDVTDGLDYLHSQNLVHFDLTLSTIVMGMDNRAKLTCISTPCLVPQDIVLVNTPEKVTRFAHLPPEVLGPKPSLYDRQAEMYCLGTALYSAWTGVCPLVEEIFDKVKPVTTLSALHDLLAFGKRPTATPFLSRVSNGIRASYTSVHSGIIYSLIELCWSRSPEGRPTLNSFTRMLSQGFD